MNFFIQKSFYVLRFKFASKILEAFRIFWYSLGGMQVGVKTNLPKIHVTWPHQVSIGIQCRLEYGIYFKFDGIWKQGPSIHIGDRVFLGSSCEFNIRQRIFVGNDSLIASGCRFIDHDHGMMSTQLMRTQKGIEDEIKIGKDVWLGCNVVVLKGVIIGDGAIVAAGAVVTKSIPTKEIWAGVPARKIGERI